MSTLSDSPVPDASTMSPLTDLPVVGPAVGWVDAALNDFGWAPAVNQLIELVLLAVGGYHAARWIIGRAVPWLAGFLVGPVNGLVDGMRAVCLLPDLAVARTARLTNARPPALLYSYGNAVLNAADHVQSAVRKGLPTLAVIGRWPGRLTCVTLVLAFAYWNAAYCTGVESRRCESPTAQWVGSAKSLLEAEEDAGEQGENKAGNDKGKSREKG
ncbi:hypothetical protein [Streptomyces sp. KR55]|uniref:hypothetical protein n=1 Tax=Streptomyces sp. KR55 TaxID=3457425 RepID=UPI003FD550BF